MAGKNKKLEKELEKLKSFKSVNNIIQRSEAENALLYGTSRGDQDPADDEMFETMMAKLVSKGASPSSEKKYLEFVEKSSTEERGERIDKKKKVKLVRNGTGPKIKQHIHAVKTGSKSGSRPGGSRSAKRKSKGRK